MKHKTITTDKATLLVVEVEEGATPKLYHKGIWCDFPNGDASYDTLPEGNWQLLGRLPDITEEQADKVVEEYTYNTGEIDGYYYYENDTQTDCPIESLNSLMYTNEVYFENPIPPFKERFEYFKEAQSKVWDKDHCYIFIKVD